MVTSFPNLTGKEGVNHQVTLAQSPVPQIWAANDHLTTTMSILAHSMSLHLHVRETSHTQRMRMTSQFMSWLRMIPSLLLLLRLAVRKSRKSARLPNRKLCQQSV
jgi:bacteriorhodopsin